MSASPVMPSFARIPRLSHMRSQRIVHVVQTDKDDAASVSIVTVLEDGRAEETQEVVDFSNHDGDIEQRASPSPCATLADENGYESVGDATGDPILFEVDLDDAAAPQLTPHDCNCSQRARRASKTSLFSNDEFEPIRMKLPKRTPQPLRLSSYKDKDTHVDVARSPKSPSSVVSSAPNHKKSSGTANPSHTPDTANSSPTLFSVNSATSSTTCVDHTAANHNHKSRGGRVFCAFEKDGKSSPKLVDVVTPDTVTGTRGLVDLRFYGYNFGWSRLAGRFDAVHNLSPEDAAELEVFLSKGPSAFPPPTLQKRSPKKSTFEKKLLDVFKRLK